MRGATTSIARYASMAILASGLLLSAAASAQLSGASDSTAGSSCSGGSDSGGDCRFSSGLLVNTSTQVKSRYAWNINADVGIFSTRDESGSATHKVSFTAVAPGAY